MKSVTTGNPTPQLGTTRDECGELLDDLIRVLADRMRVCRQHGARNIWRLPDEVRPVPVVVLVDEVAELFLMADKSEKDAIARTSTALLRVAQLGRAFGVYLIVCGQRIGSDLGPGVTALRSQLSGWICHRVNDPETANMTLGDMDPGALDAARQIPGDTPGVAIAAGTFKRVRVYDKTRDEARQNLTKLVEQSDQGIPIASQSWTVAGYLNYWLEHIVKAERRPKTYQGYEGVVRLHLIPGLGKKRLSKLSAQDVRVFITRVRNGCRCCKHGWDAERDEPECCAKKTGECRGSKLSVRMIQSIHSVLRNALQSAVREEVLPRNVAKLVKVSVPKYKVNRGLSVAEARRVLNLGQDERLYALYTMPPPPPRRRRSRPQRSTT